MPSKQQIVNVDGRELTVSNVEKIFFPGTRYTKGPTTLNIFMNEEVSAKGTITVLPPKSKAGDSILLRAEMDLIVGLTACSAEMSNNYKFKPIGYEILNPSDEKAG
jgi:uncharacterized protein YcgI (DUF1989 family)